MRAALLFGACRGTRNPVSLPVFADRRNDDRLGRQRQTIGLRRQGKLTVRMGLLLPNVRGSESLRAHLIFAFTLLERTKMAATW